VNSTASTPERRGLRHLPALDGLRAIAVLSVVGYHADIRALRGGFLGVDVFFVVSGFLITALLLQEVSTSGRVDLRSFWARRLRRLVPALATFLLVCSMFWYLFHRAELLRIRAQFAAAAGYASNWYLIATNGSYFAHLGRPSPLLHLWSLAVEEQFYLVWPLLIGLLCRTRIVRHRNVLAVLFVVIGLGSSTLMALLYHHAQSLRARSDPSRVYFGTDTRLTGLAIGAALAVLAQATLGRDLVQVPGRTWATTAWPLWRSRLREGTGIAAAIGVGISLVATNDNEPLLYEGGFFAFSALTAFLIAAAIAPTSPILGPILSWRPLRLIGTRAYGIYLWHWPVVVLTRPGVDVHFNSAAVLAIRVIAPLLLAELSYRIIETPLRYRAPQVPARHGVFTQLRQGLTAAVVVAIAGLTTLLIVSADASTLPTAGASNREVSVEESIRAGQSFLSTQNNVTVPADSSPSSNPLDSSATTVATPMVPTETTLPPPVRKGIPVLVFGDSVMVGASPAIAKALGRNVRIEAEVGRQLVDSPPLLRKSLEQSFPEVLIVNLGNNGPGDPDSLQKILQISSAVPLVIVSTVKVPKPWEANVNRQIFIEVSSHPNVVIYDWNTIATRNRSLLYSDNIHLNRVGATEFVQGISSIISRYCFPEKSDARTPVVPTPVVERCVRAPIPGFTPQSTSTVTPPVTTSTATAVTTVTTVTTAAVTTSGPAKPASAIIGPKPTTPTPTTLTSPTSTSTTLTSPTARLATPRTTIGTPPSTANPPTTTAPPTAPPMTTPPTTTGAPPSATQPTQGTPAVEVTTTAVVQVADPSPTPAPV
jgi:peptidoglycan/LPS O-acetylase OafA/YrhL